MALRRWRWPEQLRAAIQGGAQDPSYAPPSRHSLATVPLKRYTDVTTGIERTRQANRYDDTQPLEAPDELRVILLHTTLPHVPELPPPSARAFPLTVPSYSLFRTKLNSRTIYHQIPPLTVHAYLLFLHPHEHVHPPQPTHTCTKRPKHAAHMHRDAPMLVASPSQSLLGTLLNTINWNFESD